MIMVLSVAFLPVVWRTGYLGRGMPRNDRPTSSCRCGRSSCCQYHDDACDTGLYIGGMEGGGGRRSARFYAPRPPARTALLPPPVGCVYGVWDVPN